MTSPSSNHVLTGLACAIGGAATLSLNDLFIKTLSQGYALHQIILIRAFVGIVFILCLIQFSNLTFATLITRRPRFHLIRASIVMFSNVSYFLGLAALPIADAAAIGFVAPILLTLLSVAVLGEKVGWHRWGAVIAGLVGVVVMLRPEGEFHWATLLILASAFSYATTQIMTRAGKDTESAIAINFYTQIAFVVVSTLMGLVVGDGHLAGSSDASIAFLFRAWHWPPLGDWPYFAGTGLSVAIGGMLMAQAYRMNEAAVVAPFEYTSMPLTVIYGLIFFGTFPNLRGWIGIALIIGAGLYTLHRETIRGRHAR